MISESSEEYQPENIQNMGFHENFPKKYRLRGLNLEIGRNECKIEE